MCTVIRILRDSTLAGSVFVTDGALPCCRMTAFWRRFILKAKSFTDNQPLSKRGIWSWHVSKCYPLLFIIFYMKRFILDKESIKFKMDTRRGKYANKNYQDARQPCSKNMISQVEIYYWRGTMPVPSSDLWYWQGTGAILAWMLA